jgi:hypothetical protein
MTFRDIEVMELIGSQARVGIKPVIVTEESSERWNRVIISLAFLVFVVVSVFLNAAQYEVSEEVPAPIYLDGAR